MTAEDIFKDEIDFDNLALEVFHIQAATIPVYRKYLEQLKVHTSDVRSVSQIPFLPIQFYKAQTIISSAKPQVIFESSGTTGTEKSRHYVADLNLYEQSFLKCFDLFYGDINKYCILALLPSYIEPQNSSLVYMADKLIQRSGNDLSGFYQKDFERLFETIQKLQMQKQKFILIGLTYALLDFAGWLKSPFGGFRGLGLIMETGGMKGKRKEMVREEAHQVLCTAFGMNAIHSEYGMTELLSQAYSKGKGIFQTPPWMKVFIRDINAPTHLLENEKTGGINVIDLANLHSCAFIATQDLGKKYDDESFEVLGRFDNSDLRGCNLLME